MDRNEVLKMLKGEIESKLDSSTLDKIKTAKSKKEALSILEGTSVELNDDILGAIAGGENIDEEVGWTCFDKDCPDLCPTYCYTYVCYTLYGQDNN